MSEFPAKDLKKLPTGFIENVESMKTKEINEKILESEGHVYEVEKAKEEDEKLNQAKELVKELSAPYRETVSNEKAKIKYCIWALEQRGTPINKKVDDDE